MSRRYCLTLDLKDDAKLIAEYKRYHENIWPEITKSIKKAESRTWKFISVEHECS